MALKLKELIFETDGGSISFTYDEAFELYRELQILFSNVKEKTTEVKPKDNTHKLDEEDWRKIFDRVDKEAGKWPALPQIQPAPWRTPCDPWVVPLTTPIIYGTECTVSGHAPTVKDATDG